MTEPFRDVALPVAARVDDLLARMSLREKVGQLNQRLLGWTAWQPAPGRVGPRELTPALHEEVERWGGLGALYGLQRADAWSGRDWSTGVAPAGAPELTAMVQERVVAASRFGIPALFVEEAPHGHQALGAHLLPTNLGAAATWDPAAVGAAAAHTARELLARGAHIALVSCLDLLRDPRWGRAEECFGEDPLLASRFTRAVVRGMDGIAVVLKHFAGQGAGIGGRNGSGTPIGPRELAELHLPAARAGVEAGALGVMAAYNDIDGVPCTANAELLTTVLRGQWGFEGIVMADMFAVDRLMRAGLSPAAAGALALRAGVDMSLCDESFTVLEAAVDRGELDESSVDRACRRVLGLKIRLGLLDPPVPPPSFPPPPPSTVDLAADTMVLLRNELLPLAAPPARVAVIGPNADDLDSLLGDYVPPLPPGEGVTVLAGVRRLVADTTHEPGCALTTAIDGGLPRAAAAATAADLALLVLGSTSRRGYADSFDANGAARLDGSLPGATTGEGFDVADVELPAAQRDLVDAVVATGTPVVAVIVSGRPLGIGRATAGCGAVLYAWYPGPTGGQAIADIVLGGREPVGRLPVSLPSGSGVLPVAYNERLEHTVRYVDAPADAEFPFGAGLGYTTWSLGPPSTSDTSTSDTSTSDTSTSDIQVELAGLAAVAVRATLTNTGPRRGAQVVQLYARALVPGLVPRRAVLVGFTRVVLDAGASAEVHVAVDPDAHAGLGLTPGVRGTARLWLSVTGA